MCLIDLLAVLLFVCWLCLCVCVNLRTYWMPCVPGYHPNVCYLIVTRLASRCHKSWEVRDWIVANTFLSQTIIVQLPHVATYRKHNWIGNSIQTLNHASQKTSTRTSQNTKTHTHIHAYTRICKNKLRNANNAQKTVALPNEKNMCSNDAERDANGAANLGKRCNRTKAQTQNDRQHKWANYLKTSTAAPPHQTTIYGRSCGFMLNHARMTSHESGYLHPRSIGHGSWNTWSDNSQIRKHKISNVMLFVSLSSWVCWCSPPLGFMHGPSGKRCPAASTVQGQGRSRGKCDIVAIAIPLVCTGLRREWLCERIRSLTVWWQMRVPILFPCWFSDAHFSFPRDLWFCNHVSHRLW